MSDAQKLAVLISQAATRDELRGPIQDLALLAAAGGSEGDRALGVLLAEIDQRHLGLPAIKRQLFDKTDQQDVEQDLLIAVATSISGFRGEAHVLTWLHTVATNCALRFVRRRRETQPLTEEQYSVGSRFTSVATQNMAVREAIAVLPAKYRDAVTLRDLEQLSYAEVAERLGLNLNTARAHIARGRALVAGSLELEL